MEIKNNNVLFWTGIVTAIWFVWTGMLWVYSACLVISYPIGLISFFIWLKIKRDFKPRNRYIIRILITGLMLSLSVLILFLIFD
jgi:small neutral amino acid transporter SnatA (MarC family)